ncbi:MAG: M3 family oligoendopeptidase [Patescibacteria group bacterium]
MNANSKLTWDLSPLSASDDSPELLTKRDRLKKKSYEFINKWKERSDYLQDSQVLIQALDEYEQWNRFFGTDGDEGYYFSLRKSQNQNDPKIKASLNKVTDFSTKILNDIQFFELKLSKIPSAKQQEFLANHTLKKYNHFLERLFVKAKYLLSENEEKVVNLYSTPAISNWVQMLSGFISKEKRKVLTEDGKEEEKTTYEILSLIDSKEKFVRDRAASAFNSILVAQVEVAENELNTVLQVKKISDELRGFERADKARHLSDDIDSEVVDSMLKAVTGRFAISRKYYELKAKLLDLPKLSYHERNVEYGEISKKYPYDAAKAIVAKTFTNLDPEFYAVYNSFLENGNFDVFPQAGKAGGAFCAGRLITQPTYILLNHTDTLHDVLTIAHEVGHGINNELMKKVRHSLDFDTPLSTAEVASTFMEDFVLEEILKEASDTERLSIMMMKLNGDVSSIMRQVACYNFELELHKTYREKGYLAKEQIRQIFQKHMSSYMGDYVLQSEGSENWWVYWKHIRNCFYVYSYASGLLISKALQNCVKKDKAFIAKVKQFLSFGTSSSPKDIFSNLGVAISDKSFWESGLDELELLLLQTESLAKKLKKI